MIMRHALIIGRPRRLFGFAIAIACCVLAAPAGGSPDEASRTRAVIDAFVRAADALERGDRAGALRDLDGMAASVTSLRASAERYRTLARTMESTCQTRSVAIVNEIAATYQQQQRKEAEAADLEARSRNLGAQLQQLQSNIAALQARMQPLIEEANFRNACASDAWFYFKTGRCWELGFKDLFENRYRHLNNEAADLNRQQQNARQERGRLDQERRLRTNEANEARNRVAQLEAQRRHLESLDRATRGAATSLSDITLFWAQAETIMQGRLSNGIEMLRDVVPSLDRTADAPVFDDIDKRQIRSLRDTMIDFSQSIDSGKNFLSSDPECK
jgi:hypothetical protein